MARKRDYAAEYQLRKSRAQEAGFTGYWQRRRVRQVAIQSGGFEQDVSQFERAVVRSRLSAPVYLDLFNQGQDALRAKDHAEASRIARMMGYRDAKAGPAERIFWYHAEG